MAIQKIPSTSVNGPDGATRLVFGGYSSTGTYIHSSPLPAGNYIAQIRYTTSRDITNTTTTRWFPQFSLSGSVNGTILSNMSPSGFYYDRNTTQYAEVRDGNYYFNIPSTESALTFNGGYSIVTGTTVTTWTTTGGNLDNVAFPKPDITSIAMTSRNTMVLGLSGKGINTYWTPDGIATTEDSGETWNNTSTGTPRGYTQLFPFTNNISGPGYPGVGLWSTNVREDGRSFPNQVHVARDKVLIPIGTLETTGHKIARFKTMGIYDVTNLTFTTSSSSTQNIFSITGGENGSRYLAVGETGSGVPYLASSNDGIGWVSRANTTGTMVFASGDGMGTAVISAVVSGETRHVVTSSNTSNTGIVTTTNLTNFTSRTNPTSVTKFTYGTFIDRFYLIGNSDRIAISTDGFTWTSSGTMPGGLKRTMAYSSTPTNKYIIGHDDGTISTSTDGNTWTSRTSNMSTRITGIAWGDGKYVAGASGGNIRYSTDGITWATTSTNFTLSTRWILGMGYTSEGFFAPVVGTGNPSPRYFRSNDGITWTSVSEWDSYYTSGFPVHAGNRETRVYGYRTNDYHFSTPYYGYSTRPSFDSHLAMTTNANYTTNSWFTTSPYRLDSNAPIGVTFFPNETAGARNLMWGQINYGQNSNPTTGNTANGQMELSSSFNNPSSSVRILVSPETDTPTVRELIWSDQARYAVAVGDYGRIAYATAPTNWQQVTTSQFGRDDIHCLTYGDGVWLAGGDNGKMSRSTDGITWATVTSGFGTSSVNVLSHNASVFIAGGGGGYLATSTDGITWTSRTSNMGGKDINVITPSIYITDIVPDRWFIGGNDGAAAVSTDGITWTTKYVKIPTVYEVQDIVQTTGTNYVGLVGYNNSVVRRGLWYPIRSTDGLTWTVPTYRATTTSGWTPEDSSNNSNGMTELVWATGGNLFAVDTGGNGSSRNTTDGARSRYSTDGINWQFIDITPLANVTRAQRVQMVSSQYIAWATVGGGPALIARSSNAATSWSTVASPFSSSVNPWYWGAGNGFYLVSGGVSGKLYKTTNFSTYSLILFGGTSNVVMDYDSTNLRWVLVGSDGRSFYASSTGVTWTQGANIPGISTVNRIEPDGTTGNFFVHGTNTYAYGNPINGWTVSTVPRQNDISYNWFHYNSTSDIVTTKIRPDAIQYGTLVSGSSATGTISPAYLSLYATNLTNL